MRVDMTVQLGEVSLGECPGCGFDSLEHMLVIIHTATPRPQFLWMCQRGCSLDPA